MSSRNPASWSIPAPIARAVAAEKAWPILIITLLTLLGCERESIDPHAASTLRQQLHAQLVTWTDEVIVTDESDQLDTIRIDALLREMGRGRLGVQGERDDPFGSTYLTTPALTVGNIMLYAADSGDESLYLAWRRVAMERLIHWEPDAEQDGFAFRLFEQPIPAAIGQHPVGRGEKQPVSEDTPLIEPPTTRVSDPRGMLRLAEAFWRAGHTFENPEEIALAQRIVHGWGRHAAMIEGFWLVRAWYNPQTQTYARRGWVKDHSLDFLVAIAEDTKDDQIKDWAEKSAMVLGRARSDYGLLYSMIDPAIAGTLPREGAPTWRIEYDPNDTINVATMAEAAARSARTRTALADGILSFIMRRRHGLRRFYGGTTGRPLTVTDAGIEAWSAILHLAEARADYPAVHALSSNITTPAAQFAQQADDPDPDAPLPDGGIWEFHEERFGRIATLLTALHLIEQVGRDHPRE